jgi:uncharacterized protein YndB with AHSA1/START domain
METKEKTVINIETTVNAPVSKVWDIWNKPEHITQWATASEDWHTPTAQNDLRTGGTFLNRMEAKDGSFGFDFGGTYDEVRPNEYIEYTMGDGRNVKIDFEEKNGQTHISQSFEAEETNPIEMQRGGWQAILDNFKKYTEAK